MCCRLLGANLQRGLSGGVLLVRLGQHHDTFGTGRRIGYPEGGDPVFAQAGNATDSFLDLVRRDVLARPDDDVFDPAGDEKVTAGYVGAIAGIEPAVAKQLARLRRI